MRKGEIRRIKKLRREGRYTYEIPVSRKPKPGPGSNVYLLLIFIACGALGVWAGLIHNNTIIPFQSIATACCMGAIAGLCLLYRTVHRYEPTGWGSAFISLWYGGNLTCFTVLYLNRALAGNSIYTETFPILRSGISKSRNGHYTYAYIDFHGISKDIRFGGTHNELLNASRIRLTYEIGLFGYAVIKERKVL
jgi:hypothetical protein